MKREIPNYRTYQRRFGSWNKAIIAAGFDPNSELFSSKQYAVDGHQCDSIAEMIIDDWLHKVGISHERNRQYPNSRLNADFFLPDWKIYVEYFGLSGASPKNDRNVQRKIKLASDYGLALLCLDKKDLFKDRFKKKIRSFVSG